MDLVDRLGSAARLQLKARIGAANDPLECEADRIADAVMRGGLAGPVSRAVSGAAQRACSSCAAEERLVQRKCATCEEEHIRRAPGSARATGSAEAAARAVAVGGAPLPASSRAFFGTRFGRDFSDVRIHAGPAAGAAALSIGARAYTLGHNIAFAPGEYAPDRPAGQRLLAHELAHVVQQGGGGDTIRRAELEIRPAGSTGTPTANQRRAAASCTISCGGNASASGVGGSTGNASPPTPVDVGTLHAMPLFFHSLGNTPLANATGASGIGTSLHFIRNSTTPGSGNPCATCTDWKILQVVHTNAPLGGNPQRYVDNAGRTTTPFYSDVYRSGSGLHTIHQGYPDAGDQFRTTRSIYDRPSRSATTLATVAGQDFFWEAEACVTCVKTGTDKVLGCATYGFRRPWVPTPRAPGSPPPATGAAPAGSHGPVQGIGPGCRTTPSPDFVTTVRGDPSTSSYDFET